ncbi:MAG: glycosyltransferase [Bacteroidetes bacterium]|nr:glycosyltransferase [Bacteroidota bacterium]MBS1740121.1 glycosyltransferase [Bacteroidota bacterium]
MKKNVLLIGSELGKGGAERSISLLSYYLEPFYNVTLCILSGTDRQKFYKTCSSIVFIDPPETNNIFSKISAWRYRLNQIKALKKKQQIDISISFLEGPDYVNVLTKGKEKVTLSIRGSKMHDKEISGIMGSFRKRILIPWLYRKADSIVCVTDALCNELNQQFGIAKEKLLTIYNFYEVENIREQAAEALTPEEETIFSLPVIISSGRLHVAKEYDKLIALFAKLKTKRAARLMILGDGDKKHSLIRLCHSLNLITCDWQADRANNATADVYFMGFQTNAFKFYKQSTLFALASSWEGFPNVLAEALICEIPVVSTDCYTGPREILNQDELQQTPTTVAIRTKVGSLLPLLQNPSAETNEMWIEEMTYWMKQDKIPPENFDELTNRYTLDTMLNKWKNVIESKK